jgi:hypothetical protein
MVLIITGKITAFLKEGEGKVTLCMAWKGMMDWRYSSIHS